MSTSLWKTFKSLKHLILTILINSCQTSGFSKGGAIIKYNIVHFRVLIKTVLKLVYIICKNQGHSDGGYIGIYTPSPQKKSGTVLFTCGTLTHVLKVQWLVKTYTPQIKFLATPLARITLSGKLFHISSKGPYFYITQLPIRLNCSD